MNIKRHPAFRLLRPAGPLLPLAFCVAALLGRQGPVLGMLVALYAVKLCALATADSLNATFACQPSMKYVQGSAVIALLIQLPGAALAGLILYMIPGTRALLPLIPCGLLFNTEHVFYEYLYATGDRSSAITVRCITAVLTLVGLLLCAPPLQGLSADACESIWLVLTSGLSALVGMIIAAALGGKIHPKLNLEVLRHAPVAMVQTALCPALTLTALALLWPTTFTPAPLFAGLALYEACRTPFRRSALESGPMNRLLCTVSIASLLGGILSRLITPGILADAFAMTSVALLIAALCAFGLFGSVKSQADY